MTSSTLLLLIAFARDVAGLRQLQLGVTAGNVPTLTLYKDLGFTCYGTEPAALRVDGVYYDEIPMQLALQH